MDSLPLFPDISPTLFGLSMLIAAAAGAIKGAVGFAMPMIMISGLATFLSAEQALAALILPTLLTNGVQALRQGFMAALASTRKYWLFLTVGAVCLLASAQLIRVIPQPVLFLLIGGPIVLFALFQLSGWRLNISATGRKPAEILIGGIAGLVGGLSGVWGPPTVAFLTALDTPKQEQFRVQGVVYGMGAFLLFVAHLNSGVLRAETLPLAFWTVPPALAGMWIGLRLHDRMDQTRFRRLTLIVLVIAGLNLLRRGLIG